MFLLGTLNTRHLQPTGNRIRVLGVRRAHSAGRTSMCMLARSQALRHTNPACKPAGRVACGRSPAYCRAANHHPQRVHVHAQLLLVPLICEVVTITEAQLSSINLQSTRQMRGWVDHRSKSALSCIIPHM